MESVKVKVVRVDQQSRRFIVEYNGSQWSVKQVPEQFDANPPEFINCVIKATATGTILEQDYVSLIKKHYDVGQEQVFEIVRSTQDSYELVDSWGYTAYADRLFNIDTNTTSKVSCRVKGIYGKNPSVEILEALPMDTNGLIVHKSEIKDALNVGDDFDDIIDLMLQDLSSELYDIRCMMWFSSSLQEIKKDESLLNTLQECCETLLEDTDFLQDLTKKERGIMVCRLVSIIEAVEYFSAAKKIVDEKKSKGFIENILKKLTVSGLLYHPRRQFHQMLYVFLLQPQFMDDYAKDIFSTIRSKDISFWKEEGLSSEWITILEYYCRYHKPVNERPQDRNEKLIQAYSIQQALTDDRTASMYDECLNRSTLYRLSSEMEVQKPKQMLDIAFKNLVGITHSTPVNDLKRYSDSSLLANVLYNNYSTDNDTALSQLQFIGEKAIIQIKSEGITIIPKDVDVASTDNAIVASLKLWRNLQIRVPNRIRDKQTSSIVRTSEIWNEIDMQLFSRENKSVSKVSKVFYSNGDKVKFIVRKQVGETTFSCDIIDKVVVGHGTLDLADIVKYNVDGLSIAAFKGENGRCKILTGYVKNYDPANGYSILMTNQVLKVIAEEHRKAYEDNEGNYTVYCRLYHFNSVVGRYIGVDECGFPVSIKIDDEDEPWSYFSKGAIVEVGDPDKFMTNGFLQFQYIGTTTESIPSVLDCFSYLMTLCCEDQFYPEDVDENTREDKESFLVMPLNHVHELISTIEQIAGFESDYIKAYNYFGICRVISKIINAVDRVEYYDKRLKLITLLYQFNDTGKVDLSELNQLENENPAIFAQHTQLQHSLLMLKVVSCKDRPDLFSFLSQIRSNSEDEDLSLLAKYVMAYNLLRETDSNKEAESIYEHILDLLKLQKKDTNKKFYGEESQSVEFKPSMVFPPEENMQPNLSKQTTEILQQICAFLNCGGGTLFIGVANTGYEFGLSQDLAYKEFDGSRDKYTLYLDNAIHDKLGAVAARFVSRKWDLDVESDVLVVEVADCNETITLDGQIYERRGTSVRPVADKESFRKFRQQQISAKVTPKLEERKEEPVQVKEVAKVAQSAAGMETIFTSQIRNNVLHDYDYGFEDSVGYIGFQPNGKYVYQKDEMWGEEERPLTLVIHESEQKGYLICIYEGGYISKVPISEIMDKTDGNEYVRCNEKKLMFASIASKNDSIASILSNSKGDRYIRFDKVSDYEDGKMSDYGVLITEAPFDEAFSFEIVPTNEIKDFKVTSTQKSIGAIIKTSAGKEAYEYVKSKNPYFL